MHLYKRLINFNIPVLWTRCRVTGSYCTPIDSYSVLQIRERERVVERKTGMIEVTATKNNYCTNKCFNSYRQLLDFLWSNIGLVRVTWQTNNVLNLDKIT